MSQTRIMSIHRLLMCLFSAFCGGEALNGNVKHFVFDLTCDVTGDTGVKFFNFIWKISSRPLHCRSIFFAMSIGYRNRWGRYAPPPPHPAEGRDRTRPSSARVNTRTGGGGAKKCPPLRFFADSGKTGARSAAIFSIPAHNWIWHLL